MTVHKAEQILEAFNTKLQVLAPATVTTVGRSFPYTFNNASLPALQILMGSDTPVDPMPNNLTFQDWKLQVFVDIILKSSTVPLDTTLLDIRKHVQIAVMQDYTVGLNFVLNTFPSAVEQATLVAEGEMPISVMRVGFEVMYRAQIADPSA